MNGHPESASTPLQAASDRKVPRQATDLVYQTVTIAAMLLLLGSLWVF